MRFHGGDECADPGRPLSHPDRRRTVGRGRKRFVRCELQAQERARGFRLLQGCGLLDLEPVRAALSEEINGRLVEGEAEQPVRVCNGERERNRSAARMSVEMEALESGLISGAGDAIDFISDRILRCRRVGGVDLELFRHGVDAVSKGAKKRRVSNRRGRDDARKENHVDHREESCLRGAEPVKLASARKASSLRQTVLRLSRT